MVKYIAYARTSTLKQSRESETIENQLFSCEQHAIKRGSRISRQFTDDGISGSCTNRVGWNALLEWVSQEKDEVIILAVTQDRFLRNVIEYGHFKNKVESIGGRLESLDGVVTADSDINSPDDFQREYNSQIASTAFLMQNKIKVKRGRTASELKGLRQSPPALGYMTDYMGKSGLHIPDNHNSYVIKELLEKLASGTFTSKVEMLAFVKSKKLFTTNNDEYKYDLKVISRILGNLDYYAGFIYVKSEDKLVIGQHEGLISKDLQDSINQRLLVLSRKFRNTKVIKTYPFNGYLRCSICRGSMYAHSPTSKGRSYPYYYCINNECSMYKKNLAQQKVTDAFFEFVSKQKDFDFLEQMPTAMNNVWQEHYEQMHVDTSRYSAQKRHSKKRKDDVMKVISKSSNDELITYAEKRFDEACNKVKYFDTSLKDTHYWKSDNFKEDITNILNNSFNDMSLYCQNIWDECAPNVVSLILGDRKVSYDKETKVLSYVSTTEGV